VTIFQRIIAGELPAEIVHDDGHCVVFRDIHPQAPIHLLIVPKKLIPRVGEAGPEDQGILGHLLLTAGKVATDLGINDTTEGFRLVINHGRDGGEAVPHLHIHLLAGRPLQWPPG
jgi:histidine triad (HIT) family protein